jgi:hypothetical protein
MSIWIFQCFAVIFTHGKYVHKGVTYIYINITCIYGLYNYVLIYNIPNNTYSFEYVFKYFIHKIALFSLSVN